MIRQVDLYLKWK